MDENEFLEYIKTCQEVELYFAINEMGGFVWRMNHDINKGRITGNDRVSVEKDVIKMQAKMELAVDQTTRFGVGVPRETKKNPFTGDEGLVGSDTYWLWFRWWDAWSKGLSDEKFREMDADMSGGRDLSRWRPDGEWKVEAGS